MQESSSGEERASAKTKIINFFNQMPFAIYNSSLQKVKAFPDKINIPDTKHQITQVEISDIKKIEKYKQQSSKINEQKLGGNNDEQKLIKNDQFRVNPIFNSIENFFFLSLTIIIKQTELKIKNLHLKLKVLKPQNQKKNQQNIKNETNLKINGYQDNQLQQQQQPKKKFHKIILNDSEEKNNQSNQDIEEKKLRVKPQPVVLSKEQALIDYKKHDILIKQQKLAEAEKLKEMMNLKLKSLDDHILNMKQSLEEKPISKKNANSKSVDSLINEQNNKKKNRQVQSLENQRQNTIPKSKSSIKDMIKIFYDKEAHLQAQNLVKKLNKERKLQQVKKMKEHEKVEQKIQRSIGILTQDKDIFLTKHKQDREQVVYDRIGKYEKKKLDLILKQESTREFVKQIYKSQAYMKMKQENLSPINQDYSKQHKGNYQHETPLLNNKKKQLAQIRKLEQLNGSFSLIENNQAQQDWIFNQPYNQILMSKQQINSLPEISSKINRIQQEKGQKINLIQNKLQYAVEYQKALENQRIERGLQEIFYQSENKSKNSQELQPYHPKHMNYQEKKIYQSQEEKQYQTIESQLQYSQFQSGQSFQQYSSINQSKLLEQKIKKNKELVHNYFNDQSLISQNKTPDHLNPKYQEIQKKQTNKISDRLKVSDSDPNKPSKSPLQNNQKPQIKINIFQNDGNHDYLLAGKNAKVFIQNDRKGKAKKIYKNVFAVKPKASNKQQQPSANENNNQLKQKNLKSKNIIEKKEIADSSVIQNSEEETRVS